MAFLAVGLVILGFGPEYRDFSNGTFPIAWVLHVHGAIMAAWIASFVVQAYLGAKHDVAAHQRAGNFAVGLACLAWVSMIFVEWRGIVVNPLPDDVRAYDWLLPGPYVYLTFPIFLAWAYRERRRPSWHKRLMTFALLLSVQPAIQRFRWIPTTFGYWPFLAAIDICLVVPLLGYDVATLKGRLHAATVRGTALLTFAQAVLLVLWGSSPWRHFAFAATRALRGGH